jgi:outer membrane receptor protein involved in Fe transport
MTTIGRVLSLVAITFLARSAEAQRYIGYDEFNAWIVRNHANVIAGDTRVNAVLIVVDTNNQYVASVADLLSRDVAAAIDSTFASVGARNAIEGQAHELVAGRLRVPDADGQPVYVVDGVRVSRVDSLRVNSIENIQILKGADASKYGPDAATRGAIIVTLIHFERRQQVIEASHRQRLTTLGIQPERIDFGNTQMMHVRAGAVGPYPLYVTVLRLRRA